MRGAVEGSATLGAAAQLMVAEEVSCLVAMKSGSPRGLVTERELVRGVLCEQLGRTERVDAVPWRPMVAAAEDAHASDAVWLMESHALGHVPVADDRGSIVGMLAFEDALALVLEEITTLVVAAAERHATAMCRSRSSRRHPLLAARDVQTLVSFLDASASGRSVADRLCETAAAMMIVREGARMLGIVTERDLLRRFVAGSTDLESVRAGDLVSRPLVSVGPDESLDRILAHMTDREIRWVGVTDADGCCLGVVSLSRLLTSLIVEMAARLELVEQAS